MSQAAARPIVHSEAAFAKARRLMPGGVSSPVRAFKAVGGTPRFIREAHGCEITDIDGNSYIDYVGSYGPMIVGHDHDVVTTAITKAAEGPLKGILGINSAPLVSGDFNHNPHSSTFDLLQTQVIDGTFVRVLSWYDNEWGFSNRMSDTAVALAKLG